MKPIVAHAQVNLSLRRVIQLAVTGMSYRMFRSGVTVAILALAVAFLVHMLAYGLLANRSELSAYDELMGQRRLGEQITRWSAPDARTQVVRALAVGSEERLAEYRRWSGVSPGEFQRARQTAKAVGATAQYSEELPVSAHAVLVGDLSNEELLDSLQDSRRLELFIKQLKQLSLPEPLGDLGRFRSMVQVQRPQLLGVADAIIAGHQRAIKAVAEAYPERKPLQLAAEPPSDLVSVLQEAGYSFSSGELEALRTFARRAEDLNRLNGQILVPDVRAQLARRSGIELGQVNLDSVMRYLDGDAAEAAKLDAMVRESKGTEALGAERTRELSESYVRERELQSAVGESEPARQDGLLGMSERNRWLIILSFLVCAVGVANAMLMSVTERFTEIATMKCLGAMDRFVMMTFVFEAVIQGVLGGIVGLALGVLLAVLRGLVEYGALFAGASSAAPDVLLGMGVSLVVGMILAAVAAVGPAFIAARLAPMEAMRVE